MTASIREQRRKEGNGKPESVRLLPESDVWAEKEAETSALMKTLSFSALLPDFSSAPGCFIPLGLWSSCFLSPQPLDVLGVPILTSALREACP